MYYRTHVYPYIHHKNQLHVPESSKRVKFEPKKKPPKTDPLAEIWPFWKFLGEWIYFTYRSYGMGKNIHVHPKLAQMSALHCRLPTSILTTQFPSLSPGRSKRSFTDPGRFPENSKAPGVLRKNAKHQDVLAFGSATSATAGGETMFKPLRMLGWYNCYKSWQFGYGPFSGDIRECSRGYPPEV